MLTKASLPVQLKYLNLSIKIIKKHLAFGLFTDTQFLARLNTALVNNENLLLDLSTTVPLVQDLSEITLLSKNNFENLDLLKW